MSYYDSQGMEIKVGEIAEIIINSGETKKGKIIQVTEEQTTLRCSVTSSNPDGILFGGPHKNVTILNLA